MPAPLQTFIIYARADEEHKRQLLLHLRPLVNGRLIDVWHDGQIQPGEAWEKTLKTQLNASDLVLLLVSANSMNSEFIQSEELRIAFERLQHGQARIVPILVSPYSWRYDPVISSLDIRPLYRAEGPKAVTDGVWRNEHEAWASVVESLGDMIVEIQGRQAEIDRLAIEQRAAAERHRLDPFHDLMVLIKGGTFSMGDGFGDGGADEKPVHKVTLSDFYLCKYPVTQGQWKAVMGDNPSHFKGNDLLPVENVSWDDAQVFIQKLNEKTGQKYRLPTEAEWEYAAREGGKRLRFGNGKSIADPAEMNFYSGEEYKTAYSKVGEYREKTTLVDHFKPNALSLHDMSGNVWEWCKDWYAADYYKDCQAKGTVIDPPGPEGGRRRVLRGGGWGLYPSACRAACRDSNEPADRHASFGFRLALVFQ